MTKAAAIYEFWSAFGLSAFEENSVPTTASGEVSAQFPYITYELTTDSFGASVALTASLWYRSESWKEANRKAEEISAKIGRGGEVLKCDGGAVWLRRGSPFTQRMGDTSDREIKRIYLTLEAEFLTAD